MLIVESTKLALEKVASEKLTVCGIIKHGFDTGALTSASLTFGPGKHMAIDTCPVYELLHSNQVLIGKCPVQGPYKH
jgi:hypothetical protein